MNHRIKKFMVEIRGVMIGIGIVLWGSLAYTAYLPILENASLTAKHVQTATLENSEKSSDSERLAARKRAAVAATRNLPKKTSTSNGSVEKSTQPTDTSILKRQNDESQEKLNGYLTRSDGRTIAGRLFLTRDKRIKIEDRTTQRQREIPLSVIRSIETLVVREWMEEEWRFKENANNEKYFTGRSYPARIYAYRVTLRDGRKIEGNLSEVVYLDPADELVEEWSRRDSSDTKTRAKLAATRRFILYKRDKGEPGETFDDLRYVKKIQLGDDQLDEGLRKTRKSSLLQD